MSLKTKIVEYVSRKYKENGNCPSVRQIIREFGIYRVLFYKMFPGGLKELFNEAKVPFPADAAKLVESMKAKRGSAKEHPKELEEFDFEYRKTELGARIKELAYTFQLRTEEVKNEPYWRARREQFDSLCNWMLKRLRKATTLQNLETLTKDFEKLKIYHVRTIGDMLLSDKINQQRSILAQLQRQYSKMNESIKAIEDKLGMPIEKALPLINEIASIKVQFELSAEEINLIGQFVTKMVKKGWNPETLSWYVCTHFQTLLHVDSLESERQKLGEEVEKLNQKRDELRKEISQLRNVKEKTAEETHALEVIRNSISKKLNKESEILARAEMNNIFAGYMFKEGVNTLADAILNDAKFQRIGMTSTSNKLLAEVIEQFTKIVKENAENIKKEITKLSIIAEIIQKHGITNNLLEMST